MEKKDIAVNKVTAMILAGGRGTRMDILCHARPKPALPFAGKLRVIDFGLSNCVHSQINDIAILTDYQRFYLAEYLKEWQSLNGDRDNLRVLPPEVGSYSGTADAVYQNLDYLEKQGSDTVLILAGDHIYKMDYRKMLAFHQEMKADVTLGVVRVPAEETYRFGTVTVDAKNRVKEFKEKSSQAQCNLASMGIYIFDKDLLVMRLTEDAGAPGSLHDFGYSILPRMVRNDNVFAYEFKGYWRDIGTVQAYYEANMELLAPQPHFKLNSDWPILSDNSITPVSSTIKGSNIINSLISPGCVIKGRVENSALSPGVHLAEQAVVRNSVVMADASIGYHSVVDNCILDEGVHIGKFCYAGFGSSPMPGHCEMTVLGKDVVLPDCTAVGRKCSVRPGLGPEAFGRRLVPSCTTL